MTISHSPLVEAAPARRHDNLQEVHDWRRHYESGHQVGPCLFISREAGAGGSQIARDVAQHLQWSLLDKQVLDTLAERYGTSRAVLDAVDEKKIGWLHDLLQGLIAGDRFSQLSYVHRLSRLFQTAAMRGNVVIVGRGASFILPRSAGLSVRIVAPFDFRVEQLILRRGISANEARSVIEQSDHDRRAFIKQYFHHDVLNPHVYDLIVNVEQLVEKDAVMLIVNAMGSWLQRNGVSGPERSDGS
jgi:cytidylate kinase